MKNEIDILNEININNNLESIFEDNFDDDNLIKNNLFEDIVEKNVESKINSQINLEDEEFENLKNYLENYDKKESKWGVKWVLTFLFKYSLTSGFIFLLLLVTTNYEAYTNIAMSYFQKEKMQEINNSIINSVKATNITDEKNNSSLSGETDETKSILGLKEKTTNSLNKNISSIVKLRKEKLSLDIDITPYDNRIVIPKIWKNIPLVDIKNRTVSWQNELNDIFMEELEKWVVRYPWSVKPWQIWNSFIFWHSSNFPWIKWDYNDVFALLDKLEDNDEIIIYYHQKKYIYKVKWKSVVNPWNIDIFKSNKEKAQVMIMTCRPIWTTLNRLVVTWELIEQ